MSQEQESAAAVRVRYGRASLTVARSGPVGESGALAEVLDAYERGEARPASVARAFLRERVIEHSPSFEWRSVKLAELIPAVTAVSSDPELRAQTPKELADELVRARAEARTATTVTVAEPKPAVPAETQVADAAPAEPRRGRFPLSLIPRTGKGRIAVLVALLLVAGAAYGVDYYFSEVPDRLADDFRKDAAPAATRVADAMDDVYFEFDGYLNAYTIPASELRNADDYQEIKRRLLPVYDNTDEALDSSERAIRHARTAIRKQRERLRGVPTAPLVDDSDPVKEARAAVREANEYLQRSTEFLDDFVRFIRFERKAVDLRRRDVVTRSEAELAADADLEEYKAAVERDLAYAQKSRKDRLELDPPPDAERLHKISIEGATITVDFLADVKAALDALDPIAYEAAIDNVIAESRRIGRQESRAILVFEAKSGLQRSTQQLAAQADKLEETIRSLGTGNGDDSATDHARPDPPDVPPRPDAGGGEEEGSVS